MKSKYHEFTIEYEDCDWNDFINNCDNDEWIRTNLKPTISCNDLQLEMTDNAWTTVLMVIRDDIQENMYVATKSVVGIPISENGQIKIGEHERKAILGIVAMKTGIAPHLLQPTLFDMQCYLAAIRNNNDLT